MRGKKVWWALILILGGLMALVLLAVSCTSREESGGISVTSYAVLATPTGISRGVQETNRAIMATNTAAVIAMQAPVITREPPTPIPDIPSQRLIIRNARLSLVVEDPEVASERISALVEELDGYVVSLQLSKYDQDVRANLTVRVPAERLNAALVQLRELALEVRQQSLSGEDVTQEYVDLQARLRHLEATEAQLLTFLEAAEDTEATLSVYAELRRIQEEIERIKGRSQYLEQSSALSTIDIELIPESAPQPVEVTGWRPQGALRDALDALVDTCQFLVDALIWSLVYALPVFVLPLVVLIWLARRWLRRRKKRRASEP